MNIHFSGVGGVGMSNLARLALAAGHRVRGSDRRRTAAMDQLLAQGADRMLDMQLGQDVDQVDMLVRSVAIPEENPDVLAARAHCVPVWTRMQCLSCLVDDRDVIAIAGSFGKSSTAALMADILLGTGQDPTIYVGASMPSLGSGARWGCGRLAVVEACEYRMEILHLRPKHLLITNLAVNHEDEFGNDLKLITRLFDSYLQINAARLETVWVDQSDPGTARLCLHGIDGVQSWGRPDSDWHAHGAQVASDRLQVRLLYRGRDAGVFHTRWSGLHLVRSLVPVLGMAKLLGLRDQDIEAALLASRPLPRRYQILQSCTSLEVVDDNARLPDQVATTLATARARAGSNGRVVAVLGVWGMLNRRDLAGYSGAVANCDEVFVLPSTRFEAAQGGPEPDGADAALVDLIRCRGIGAQRLNSASEVAALVSGEHRTVVVTLGYESFAQTFGAIHRELSVSRDVDAPLALA